jgi:hypothetical protein
MLLCPMAIASASAAAPALPEFLEGFPPNNPGMAEANLIALNEFLTLN